MSRRGGEQLQGIGRHFPENRQETKRLVVLAEVQVNEDGAEEGIGRGAIRLGQPLHSQHSLLAHKKILATKHSKRHES